MGLGHEGVNLTGEYFTSGSDYQIANNFVWCSENNSAFASLDIPWGPGEPSTVNVLGTEEDCVTVNLATGVTKKNYFSDVDCAASYRFICEVRVLIFFKNFATSALIFTPRLLWFQQQNLHASITLARKT